MGMTVHHPRAPEARTGLIVAGAVLLAVGASMLLDTTGPVDVKPGRLIGPFVMIVIGIVIMAGGKSCRGDESEAVREKARQEARNRWIAGMWMIGLGCWLMIAQGRMFGMSFATSWPLLLILVGALIAARGWR